MRKLFEILGDVIGAAALFFTGWLLIVAAGLFGGPF